MTGRKAMQRPSLLSQIWPCEYLHFPQTMNAHGAVLFSWSNIFPNPSMVFTHNLHITTQIHRLGNQTWQNNMKTLFHIFVERSSGVWGSAHCSSHCTFERFLVFNPRLLQHYDCLQQSLQSTLHLFQTYIFAQDDNTLLESNTWNHPYCLKAMFI